MMRNKTPAVAALTAVLMLGLSPPAAAGGDLGFGIYFGHGHHHHYRPHKHYRPHRHYRPHGHYRPYKRYRRYPYPRYYRFDYFYEPWRDDGLAGPWIHRPYPRFKECYFRHGRRYCRWVYD